MTDFKTAWLTSWLHLRKWTLHRGLPVLPPLAAVIELTVMVAAIVLIDWAFPTLEFLTLEPSPFWLPVLLLSLQYGTVAGLLAAGAATAVYVFNGVAEQAVGENFFSYLLRIWALPILWIGVALVLGQFRLRQIAVKLELRQKLEQREEEATRCASYAGELENRCHRLERELTTRNTAPAKSLLDVLSKFSGPSHDIGPALDILTQKFWPGTQISLWSCAPNGFNLVASSGWPQTAAWATSISANHPLFRALVQQKRPVSILTMGDENVLAGHGIAAHPISTPSADRVVGMLKIEVMDPVYLERETISHLALISRLFALMLSDTQAATAETSVPSAKGMSSLLQKLTGASSTQPSEPEPTSAPDSVDEARRRRPHPLRSS